MLARVKSDILREESKENMKAENMALNLGYYQMLGDYTMYDKYFDGLQGYRKDIPKTAEKYLDKKPGEYNTLLSGVKGSGNYRNA